MSTSLVDRLQAVARLSPPELAAVESLTASTRMAAPNEVLLEKGQQQGFGIVLVEGWAMRHCTLPTGDRQLMRFLIPGDLCDPTFFVFKLAIHSITTITSAKVATFQSETLLEMFELWPRIGWAFWSLSGHEQAVLQQRLAVLGRCNSYERTAYLIWELWCRLDPAGYASSRTFHFPISPELLADALSLNLMNTMRALDRLEADGYIELASGKLSIPDPERLQMLATASAGFVVSDELSEALKRRVIAD